MQSWQTLHTMSPDCHMLIVLGLVLSQIVVSMAVRRDSGTAKALMVSQRNVAMFPCGVEPYSTPVQRCKVRNYFPKWEVYFLLVALLLFDLHLDSTWRTCITEQFTSLCPQCVVQSSWRYAQHFTTTSVGFVNGDISLSVKLLLLQNNCR